MLYFDFNKEEILYFQYSNKEIEYLKKHDKLLGEAIDKIGPLQRPVNTDLFSSLIYLIIGQQISTIAQKTKIGRAHV